jgi:branched-chain amino acid transport system substrate-binding protein
MTSLNNTADEEETTMHKANGLQRVLLAFGILMALGGSTSVANAQGVAKLGIGYAESGPSAFLSGQYRKGYEAAIDVANREEGPVKFELVARDHRGVPAEAVAVAKRLIEQDEVKTIDMVLPSTVVFAVMSLSKESKTPLVAGYAYAPSIVEQGNPYVFRTSTNSNLVSIAMAKVIHAVPGNNTIALLAPNDDYGRSVIEFTEKALAKIGSPKIVYKDYYARDQTDFSAILLKIKSLNPDSLYIDVRYPASVTVMKQMAEIGLKKPVFSSVNFYNEKLANEVGDLLEGTHMSADWSPNLPDEASKKFIEEFKRKFGTVPDTPAAYGFTAAMTAIKAIQSVGVKASKEEIRAAIAKADFASPIGRIHFDNRGDANTEPRIMVFHDKAFRLIN